MNHDRNTGIKPGEAKEHPNHRRLLYRISPEGHTPEMQNFYAAIMLAMIAEQQRGEVSSYSLPDWLEYTTGGIVMRITTRFFHTERGIGFLIGNQVFTLTIIPEKRATKGELLALQDLHEFLHKRNEEDGVKYPDAEFAFAEEHQHRLKIEKDLKTALRQSQEQIAEIQRMDELASPLTKATKRHSLTAIARELKMSRSNVSDHAKALRKRRRIKTPEGQNLTETDKRILLRYIESIRQEGRKSK
ncbi:hypothetical protein IAD21_02422 [Abditibacteriota bacterium]|nr:hypothetical protein IAD21_02422 [Abditibacteriota bacterium]